MARMREQDVSDMRSTIRFCASAIFRFASRGIVALDRVSFDVGRGQICGLIGPNGAGKTTLFNCLSRLYTPESGDITFARPCRCCDRRAHRIAALGIGRTFQNLALFRTMSVRRNILVGAHARTRSGFLSPTRCACRLCGREERDARA